MTAPVLPHLRRLALGAVWVGIASAAAGGVENALPPPVSASAPRTGFNLVLKVNPYAAVDWTLDRQVKANFHAHTTNSDGKIQPSAVIDMYQAAGYDMLAISDHDRCTWPWSSYGRNPEQIGLVAAMGNELSRRHHVLSLFSAYAPTTAYALDEALAGVGTMNGLAAMCHPSSHWPEMFPLGIQTRLAQSLKNVTRGNFTVETWFRTKKDGRNILMGNFSFGYLGALNLELHSGNSIRCYLQPASTNAPAVDLQAVPGDALGINPRDGQWHHLAATRSGDVLSLYLDGILAAHTNGASASFSLQGDFFYFGRDTRVEDLHLDGDLDEPRLWSRALSANEILRLAQGYSPGAENGISRDGLMAEYGFETSAGSPTPEGATAMGQVDDTGGNPDGPFHAFPSAAGGGSYMADVPPALAKRGGVQRAMRFSPPHVHPDALKFYESLYIRYSHLFGIEIANPYSDHRLDKELWDLLLDRMMPQRPVWGMAGDDMHYGAELQFGWEVLLVPQLDNNEAKQALRDGAYYVSTARTYGKDSPALSKAPKIDEITHDPAAGSIRIRASDAGMPLPESAYAWISGGQTVHIGSTLDYRLVAGIRNYARAEITGEGGKTFTNPFGFAPDFAASNPAPDNRAPAIANPAVPAPAFGMDTNRGAARTAIPVPITRDLVAYLKLDDGQLDRYATTAQDVQGSSPGRLAGFDALTTWLSGKDARIDGALQFDGILSHVRIPRSDSLDIGTNAVSISLWVNLAKLPSQLAAPFAGIYDSDIESYVLYLDRQARGIRFKVTDAAFHSAAPLIPETQIQPEIWHHVVGVYDGSASPTAGQTRIYLDGRLQEERNGSDSSPGHGLTRALQPGQVAAIGRKGTEDKYYFEGAVDDVAIWRRALSSAEVLHIFENGSRGIPLDR